MKYRSLIIVLAIALFSGCKKQNTPEKPTEFGSGVDNSSIYTGSNAKTINDKTIKDYLAVPGDPDLEKLQNALYAYFVGMQKVFQNDPSILLKVYNRTKPAFQSGLFLKKFIGGSGACKTMFNSEVGLAFPERAVADYCDVLTNDMVYKGVGYQPIIYFYNSERAELVDDYYLAILVEAEDPDKTNKDYIPALHIKKNGQVQLKLIDSKQGYIENDPVFVLEVAANGKYNMPGGGYTEEPCPTGGTLGETFNTNGCGSTAGYTPPPPSPTSGNTSPPVPAAGSTVHEGVHISVYHELIQNSEYAISYKITYLNPVSTDEQEHVKLAEIPRTYIDCNCYVSLKNQPFVKKTNGLATISFLTF